MLRRAFLVGAGGLGIASLHHFVTEWYQRPESEYIESLSLGELSETIHIRFTSDDERREQIHQYLTYHLESGEIDEVHLMDARRTRLSIDAPDDIDAHGLALVDEEGEPIEEHEFDFGIV